MTSREPHTAWRPKATPDLFEQIYLVRKFSGQPQVKFARALGITQGWLSKLENGQGEVNASLLLAFRSKYGISADQFLDGTINYRELAEKFGNKSLVAKQYNEGPQWAAKAFWGLLVALEDTLGKNKTE